MAGIALLAPESIYHIASYLSSDDATSFACAHSSLRDAGQRVVFRSAVFKHGMVDERLLQFMRSLYARPDMGKYVQDLHIEPNLAIAHAGQRASVLKTIDGLWTHLPGLRRLALLWYTPLDALTFDGCTDGLVSLRIPHDTVNVRTLVRRNRGLLHLSILGLSRDEQAEDAPAAFDAHSAPKLMSVCCELSTLASLVPGRGITILSLSQPVRLEEFLTVAPILAQTTGQLRKLYVHFVGDNRDDLEHIAQWTFMEPFSRHMPHLTSLTIKLALSWFAYNYTNVFDMCRDMPSALKSLRTLRVWLPGPLGNISWRNRDELPSDNDVDDDLDIVQCAHKSCPSLRHVSLFYRIDWYWVLPEAKWIPLVRGSHRSTVAAWLLGRPSMQELETKHAMELDSVETDSLASEPADYVEYEPSDNWSDSGHSESTADVWDENELLEEVMELEHEGENLPPPESGLSEEAWNEMLSASMNEHALQPVQHAPDPDIAALLEEVEAVQGAR